jgi:SAM-dependent methyltransferase
MSAFDKKKLEQAYDAFADEREQSGLAPWKSEERRRALDAFKRAGAAALLEIGAGTGRDSLYFQEHGLAVTAVDLSERMVELCRNKGLTAYRMDFSRMSFADRSFDAVFAMNCLLHVPKAELRETLGEIARVLKPGGLFYLGVYGGRDSEGIWEEDSYEPKRFFSFHTDEGIVRAVESCFEAAEFRRISLGGNELGYQSLLLRRPPSA